MTKKRWTVLALVLLAPAAFGQKVATVPAPAAGQVKVLREEIKRDKLGLSAKAKAAREEKAQLVARMKAESAQIRATRGTRAEKTKARKALREKYAKLMKEAREKSAFERRHLREDMAAKSGLIRRLRQS